VRADLLLQVEAEGTADARELTGKIAEALAALGGIRSVKLLASRPLAAPPGEARQPKSERLPG